MGKTIYYKEDARQRLFDGIKTLYDAVAVTYGPQGGNVVIVDEYGYPTITHDGVTVAQAVSINETEKTGGQNVGIELIKNAAHKLNNIVGDGTTTVTVLTYHIIKQANELIKSGVKAQELRKELEQACTKLIETLDTLAESIESDDPRIASVATVSAGDPVIGNLIAEIVKEIGKDGVITVELGQTAALESEIVEGHALNVGYKSPLFVTDQNTSQAVIDQPSIILANKILVNPNDIIPLIGRAVEDKITNLVVIANEIKGDALNILLVNKIKGSLNIVAIEADKEQIDDISKTTGALVISEQTGITAENASLDILGKADKIIVTSDKTSIIAGKGDKEQLQIHLDSIKAKIDKAPQHEKDKLTKRYADIIGKAAIIKVGGNSESEIDEKKYRVDDAVAATKAALHHGIVAGGGTTYIHLSKTLDAKTDGEKLLKSVLLEPFKRIMENAQLDPSLITKAEGASYGYGYNVLQEPKLINLRENGIVDPLQVTRESLLSSVSIAATVITINAIIVDEPKK